MPFHFDQGLHIVISAKLDNVPLSAVLNTTSPAAVVLNFSTARSIFGWHEVPAGLQRVADTDAYTYPFAQLSLGGASVQNPTVRLREFEHWARVDAFVGLAALKPFHVYISSNDEMIYLTARDAH